MSIAFHQIHNRRRIKRLQTFISIYFLIKYCCVPFRRFNELCQHPHAATSRSVTVATINFQHVGNYYRVLDSRDCRLARAEDNAHLEIARLFLFFIAGNDDQRSKVDRLSAKTVRASELQIPHTSYIQTQHSHYYFSSFCLLRHAYANGLAFSGIFSSHKCNSAHQNIINFTHSIVIWFLCSTLCTNRAYHSTAARIAYAVRRRKTPVLWLPYCHSFCV